MFKSFQMCNKRRLKITLLSVQNCELGLKYQELSLEVLTMGLVKEINYLSKHKTTSCIAGAAEGIIYR